MALHPDIEKRLVCPSCRSALEATPEGRQCRQCEQIFLEESGVPLLRTDATRETVIPVGGNGYAQVYEILNDRGPQRFIRDLFGTNYVPNPFSPQGSHKA